MTSLHRIIFVLSLVLAGYLLVENMAGTSSASQDMPLVLSASGAVVISATGVTIQKAIENCRRKLMQSLKARYVADYKIIRIINGVRPYTAYCRGVKQTSPYYEK